MVTAVPAQALHLEGRKGVLPRRGCDIVLLDSDLKVSMTLVGGRVVYRPVNWFRPPSTAPATVALLQRTCLQAIAQARTDCRKRGSLESGSIFCRSSYTRC